MRPGSPLGDGLAWIGATPVLSHSLVALALMAALCPMLRALRNPAYGWYAAAFVTVYYYAREAAQAERAFKPLMGQPASFFVSAWPGAWAGGGARLSEWLAPTIVALLIAWTVQRRR
jgi:hypothetical protein